jgi:osmoprotectant transport system substrate-binding protein
MSPPQLASLVALLLVFWTGVTSAWAQSITVGGKNFTEQQLIAEITGQFLKAKGYAVRVRTGFATPGIRREQEMGLIDVYWEYTGTSLRTFNNIAAPLSAEETYARVKELDAKKGLVWLTPSRVNNTYALAMRRAEAQAKGITSISDLATRIRQGEQLKFASNTEFYIRPDGLRPLQQAYRFAFQLEDVIRVDTGAIYDVLREGRGVDVGLVFSTDGRIKAYDLLVLEDDRQFFPSYLLTPVVRQRTLEQHPKLAGELESLAARLDSVTMAELNAMVDIGKSAVEEVALSFLRSRGLM